MDLENRMDVVESAIGVMQTDIAVVRSNYVARGDYEVLSGKLEKLQATCATNDELGKLSAKVDKLQATSASKEDLGKLSAKVDKLQATSATKEEVARVSAKVDVISSNYVTREDLAKAIDTLTWKMYLFGTALMSTLTAVTYFVARNVH